MNRRGFFALIAGSTAAVGTTTTVAPANAAYDAEPPSPNHRFEDFNCGIYVQPSAYVVGGVLGRLGWDPQDARRPLLVVPVEDYALAVEIVTMYRDAIAFLATPVVAENRWYVAYRGRAIGSQSGYDS